MKWSPSNVANKLVRYTQGFLGLRPDDVILASFPKSGNTWIRFFFCNLLGVLEWDGRVVDFAMLDRTMPELGVDNLLEPWPYDAIPRVVKTHKTYWPIFSNKRSILLLRDPRDVMVSFYHFENAKRRPRFEGSFSAFIRHRKLGLEAWFRHYQSWKDHSTVRLKYEDLKKDDVGQFKHLLNALHIAAQDEHVQQAVINSRFDRLRAIEEKYGHSKPAKYEDDFRFTRRGEKGDWKAHFRSEDLDYYEGLKTHYGLDDY